MEIGVDTVKLIINDIPPSNNKFMGNGSVKKQAHEYQNIKKQWAILIRLAVGRNKPKEAIEKAIVTITYFFPNRIRRDPDNYSGKFINDGLVKAGVLVDDSFNNVELRLIGNYDKDDPRTEIEIKEVS